MKGVDLELIILTANTAEATETAVNFGQDDINLRTPSNFSSTRHELDG